MALQPQTVSQPQFADDETPEWAVGSCPECNDTGTLSGCPNCGKQDQNAAKVAMDELGRVLQAKFSDVERKRQPVELRWLEDLRQFHGRYDPHIEQELREAESCQLFLNITKPKTQSFAARMMDMILPTDEKNWGLEPSPVPEIAGINSGVPDKPVTSADLVALDSKTLAIQQMASEGVAPAPQDEQAAMQGLQGQGPVSGQQGAPMGAPAQAGTVNGAAGPMQGPPGSAPSGPAPLTTPEGNPVLVRDLVSGVEKEAEARCKAMAEEIDDQLEECSYNAVQRQGIDQMAKLGTAVLMGPVILDEYRTVWVPSVDKDGKTQFQRKRVPNKERRPGVQWIDLWNVYPDMTTPEPADLEFIFIQHLVNASTFKRMAKRFDFDPEATKLAIATRPFNAYTLNWLTQLRDLSETNNLLDQRYRLLRYHGDITTDDMRAAGMDPEAMGFDDLDVIRGVVWLCEGIVLKVDINPLDSMDLPFSWMYCDKDEQSIFGRGIPRLMRGEQESVNSVWRMKHDNAGLSVAPQTVMRLNAVTPADGDYHLKPKKVWYVADDIPSVNNVFGQFSVDSHQGELNDLLQLGIRFADDVTMMPLIMQGDMAPHITQTAQGISLLYNSSTVILRRAVKLYDDCLTIPMINRFYEWNMQFSEREDIKGDFSAIARGSSSLLDKEQRAQSLNNMMQMVMNPLWAMYTNKEKLYDEWVKANGVKDVKASEDEIKSEMARQQQMEMAAAQSGQKPGADPQMLAIQQQKVNEIKRMNDIREATLATNERIKMQEIASRESVANTSALGKLALEKTKQSAENERLSISMGNQSELGTGL